VTVWADRDVIHLLIAGARAERDAVVEIGHTASRSGLVSLGERLLAAEILGRRRVSIRIEEPTLMFFDPDTRERLRTRPNPLRHASSPPVRHATPR
jgi:hypothetical protein